MPLVKMVAHLETEIKARGMALSRYAESLLQQCWSIFIYIFSVIG